jgi:hypothetical protein
MVLFPRRRYVADVAGPARAGPMNAAWRKVRTIKVARPIN